MKSLADPSRYVLFPTSAGATLAVGPGAAAVGPAAAAVGPAGTAAVGPAGAAAVGPGVAEVGSGVAAVGSGAAKDQPGLAGRRDPRRGVGRTEGRFRAVLARREADPEASIAAGAVPGCSTPDALRPAAAPRGGGLVGGPSAPRSVDRILVGAGTDGAEARIRIVAGPLAGCEIRLCAGAGQDRIEAQLLTSTGGSRETLMAAMDEIRRRLRSKGIALATGRAQPAPHATRGGRRGGPTRQTG